MEDNQKRLGRFLALNLHIDERWANSCWINGTSYLKELLLTFLGLLPRHKDENISFDGYISNLILQIYREISVDIFTQNIDERKLIKIHRNIEKNFFK